MVGSALVLRAAAGTDRPMSQKLSAVAPSVASGKVPAPVRVKLKRVNCDQAIPYPPDGQAREWWQRLKNALGTPSSAFVEASLYQLVAAARLPNSGISEIAVNASLAFIESAKRRVHSRFSNRPGSSTFRPSTSPVSMSLAGSCFSSYYSAPRPFHHGIRRRGGTIFWATLPSM
jgi:hypothetical protein